MAKTLRSARWAAPIAMGILVVSGAVFLVLTALVWPWDLWRYGPVKRKNPPPPL